MVIEIPKQLQNSEFRFVLLGKWNKWKNVKTKEIIEVDPKDYQEYEKNKDWKPLGKTPFEEKWQERGYKFDDQKLLTHINTGNNFGVIGGYGGLVILDIDDPKLAEEFEKPLHTYTIKTGSGGKHFYLISEYNTNHVLINKLGELRAKNYQVVSAPCRHPSGNYYEIVNVGKINPFTKVSVKDIKEIIQPYLREEQTTTTTITKIEKCGFLGKKVLNKEIFQGIEKIIEPYGAIISYDGSYKPYKVYHSTTQKPDTYSKLKFTGEDWSEATITKISIFSDKIVCILDNKKHICIAEGEIVKEVLKKHKEDFEKMIGIKVKVGKEEFIEKITSAPKTENKGKDTSRSGLEYRKILALLREGKSREEIYKIMEAYSKWASSPEQYRSLTFEKAENFILQKIEEETKIKNFSKGVPGIDFSFNEPTTTLEEVHNIYKKYFNIEDTKRIDIILAVALSQKLEGIPIWLILVGPSADMKSVQLNSLRNDDVYVLHNLTSKTLVNGYADKKKFPDLAPELNNKIVIIPDMAQILKLPPIEKGELWGQLRDLYDGLAGKVSGMGCRAQYEGIKVTLLAGSTPAIDGQILINQDLGTRELIYRTSGTIKKINSMKKCFDNEEFEERIKIELREKTSKFLERIKIIRNFINPKIIDELMNISTYVTYMRATAEFDYNNDLRNDVYPEEPTRIAKQMKRLYLCLTNLAADYPEDRALEILWHIAKSSAFPLRIKIFNYLLKNNNEEHSTSEIAKKLYIGKSTVQRECNIFWNLRLVDCRKEQINSLYDRTYDYWKINQNHEFIKEMLKNTHEASIKVVESDIVI